MQPLLQRGRMGILVGFGSRSEWSLSRMVTLMSRSAAVLCLCMLHVGCSQPKNTADSIVGEWAYTRTVTSWDVEFANPGWTSYPPLASVLKTPAPLALMLETPAETKKKIKDLENGQRSNGQVTEYDNLIERLSRSPVKFILRLKPDNTFQIDASGPLNGLYQSGEWAITKNGLLLVVDKRSVVDILDGEAVLVPREVNQKKLVDISNVSTKQLVLVDGDRILKYVRVD